MIRHPFPAAAVAAVLLACAPAADATGAAHASALAPVTVKIANFTFGPTKLTVSPGMTVTWVNDDDIPHTVVASDNKTFRSKVLDTGDRFSFTFTAAGTYSYYCSIHPHMTGKVVVVKAS